jgi:hypothetical protein
MPNEFCSRDHRPVGSAMRRSRRRCARAGSVACACRRARIAAARAPRSLPRRPPTAPAPSARVRPHAGTAAYRLRFKVRASRARATGEFERTSVDDVRLEGGVEEDPVPDGAAPQTLEREVGRLRRGPVGPGGALSWGRMVARSSRSHCDRRAVARSPDVAAPVGRVERREARNGSDRMTTVAMLRAVQRVRAGVAARATWRGA